MGDNSDDDNYLFFGTPLEPYDEDEVPKKRSNYQDVSEQYALDANGKRRFHGAFTGGFSAGYGNTVAAPEGWAPSAFKSSRSDRNKQLVQKPEDFMDEEDRGEFGIAPKEIRHTKAFESTKRPRQATFQDGPIPGLPVLHTLLEPVHETAAMKILKSMGWRPGKGVGAKMTSKEKKAKRKLYTCHVPKELRQGTSTEPEDKPPSSSSEESSDDEDEYSEILFEPDDYEPYIMKPKLNNFGLGYVGLDRHSVLGNFDIGDGEWKGSHLLTVDKGKKVSIRGQAFGVGALEEEDEDIYSKESMSNYDFTLGGPSKSKKKEPPKAQATGNFRRVLEGFVAASHPPVQPHIYSLPALPQGYVPSSPIVRKTRFAKPPDDDKGEPSTIRDRGLGRHELTANQRGVILGEQTREEPVEIQKPKTDIAKEIKEAASKTYEERIAAITGRNINFVNNSDGAATSSEATGQSDAKAGVFKPFATNLAKQTRYESYVASRESGQNVDCSSLEIEGASSRLSEWEKVREKSEFEQAYKLYRPLTGFMNDRFTTATHAEGDILTTVSKQDSSAYANPEKQEAARLGMFGKMTREVARWTPESLLCKRFNVPEPHNGGYADQSQKKKSSYSIFEFLDSPVHNKQSFLREQSGFISIENNKPVSKIEIKHNQLPPPAPEEEPQSTSSPKKRLTVAELFMQEKEKERERLMESSEKLAFQKELTKPALGTEEFKETIDNFNKVDLYKAIFLSDSESETENDATKIIEGTKEPELSLPAEAVSKRVRKSRFDSPPKNIERNTSPPKGIFANINFDRLNSWQKDASEANKDSVDSEKNVNASFESSMNNNVEINEESENMLDLFGPKPPVKHVFKSKDTRNNLENKDIILETSKGLNDMDLYGPKLPEKHVFKPKEEKNEAVVETAHSVQVDSSSSDTDGWVEKDGDKPKKKSKHKSKDKKSKKSKKKKSEHKHKSKRKHRHRSSS